MYQTTSKSKIDIFLVVESVVILRKTKVWGVFPYISHICLCRPKGYGFCAVSVSTLKRGLNFCSCGSGIGYGFQGTGYGSVLVISIPNE